MDSSVSQKDEIWFLRVCHHISAGLCFMLIPLWFCISVAQVERGGVAQSVKWPDYRLGELGFESRRGKEIFRFSKTSRPSPVPTHHPNDLVPGIKRSGLELDRSLPSDAEVKIECLYATPRICFHDVHRENCYGWCVYLPACDSWWPGSIPCQAMWDFWCTEYLCDWSFSENLVFF